MDSRKPRRTMDCPNVNESILPTQSTWQSVSRLSRRRTCSTNGKLLIRRVVRPEVKGCYRNAHLLTLLFPDRVRYVEGKTHTVIPIDHAFNRVGDKYIDITFEFALELDPTQYEYVAFGEYPAGVIEEITNQTGYYGDIYRFCYCAAQMALEKMNPRT